jgi:predicted metal-binding membrane protein
VTPTPRGGLEQEPRADVSCQPSKPDETARRSSTRPPLEPDSLSDMETGAVWSAWSFATTLSMWTAMMAAMMIPSAMPLLRGVAASNHDIGGRHGGATPLPLIVVGYVTAWTAFSAFATVAQLMLRSATQLSPSLALINPRLSAITLIGAGLYEVTPFKGACLSLCRAPLGLLLQYSKGGARNAVLMGLDHGVTCVACCWPLMLVLFAVGVMNFPWVVILAAAVALEKLAGTERWPRRLIGGALVAWGLGLLVTSL